VQGDVVIDVPPESQVHKQVIRKSASDRVIEMNPATRLYYVEVAEPDMHEPTGDFERLKAALAREWGIEEVTAPLTVLARLQPALRKGNWSVTVALHKGNHDTHHRLLDVWPGFWEGRLYGLAVDVGSTTIAAHLTDLRNGSVAASAGVMNPQIRFGEDLMSRVSYAMMNPGGDREMTAAVREALGRLAAELAAEAGIEPRQIVEAVFVCNPVMHHLLLGIDPVELGQAPFALATSSGDGPRGWPRWGSPASTRPRAPMSCPASRATWAPTPPPWRCRNRRRRPRTSSSSSTWARTPRSCSATATACSPAPRPPAPPSRGRRSRAASAPPRAPSSGSRSTP
jgi:hypothetical protein